MTKYQIEATIERFEINSDENLTVQLKGCSKYCFEKIKDKEYWNIFENAEGETDFKFKSQNYPIEIKISKNEIGMQHLLGHAFAEKKKLKFELNIDSELFIIISISHASD